MTHSGQLRVLIVEDDTLVGMGLTSQLQKLGHVVVGQAANATQAVELFDTTNPDLILVDIQLEGDDGIELATTLNRRRPCPMVIISAYSDTQLIDRAAAAGVFGYLIKPVTDKGLEAQIEIAVSRFQDTQKLVAEKEKLAADLEARKLMERAKGILMKRTGLSEGDAHRRLQQESQKRRLSLPDLCKRIIESDELLGG